MPLLGIRNKFIYQKYQIYWVSFISGIINIGYQKYFVSEIRISKISGTISDISEIYWVSEILGIRNIRYLLISVLSYQSSIIEKMSELPVTNLHYFIRNKNPASYFLPDVRQVSFCRTPS